MRRRFAALGAALLTLALGATACSAAATGSASSSQATGPVSAGTVTVKAGNKVVCVMTIKAGKGSCTVNTAAYPPGTLKFVASYGGGAGLRGSAGSTNLTLRRATSTTRLTLSAARVTFGHEQAERLSVRVAPQYSGTPAGKVTVSAGRAMVCVITLASGAGSCTLTATKLAAGSYRLVAGYAGSASFAASASAAQTLVVTG
jgi:hypothetical protein